MHYTRQEVIAQRYFYRNHYRKAVKALFVSIAMILVLVVAIAYVGVMHRIEPAYFATAADGALVRLQALDGPNLSSTPLIN